MLDTCEHCGELLDKKTLEAHHRREERDIKKAIELKLIEIYPDDKLIVVAMKYLIRGGQIIFFGLLSFFIWLIAVMSG